MKRRRAHTLVECTVALSLLGAALASVAFLMHATRQANRRVRDAADSAADLGRLAWQLRTDAHRASSAQIDNPAVVSFALPDHRHAQYALAARGVERVVRQGEAVRHRETFGLPAACAGRWLLRHGSGSPVVSLVLEPTSAGQSGEAAPCIRRVDAAVGLFRFPAQSPQP